MIFVIMQNYVIIWLCNEICSKGRVFTFFLCQPLWNLLGVFSSRLGLNELCCAEAAEIKLNENTPAINLTKCSFSKVTALCICKWKEIEHPALNFFLHK